MKRPKKTETIGFKARKIMTGADLPKDVVDFLCEELGLPSEGLISLTIRIDASQPMVVEAQHYVMTRPRLDFSAPRVPSVDERLGRFKELRRRFAIAAVEFTDL